MSYEFRKKYGIDQFLAAVRSLNQRVNNHDLKSANQGIVFHSCGKCGHNAEPEDVAQYSHIQASLDSEEERMSPEVRCSFRTTAYFVQHSPVKNCILRHHRFVLRKLWGRGLRHGKVVWWEYVHTSHCMEEDGSNGLATRILRAVAKIKGDLNVQRVRAGCGSCCPVFLVWSFERKWRRRRREERTWFVVTCVSPHQLVAMFFNLQITALPRL